MADRTLLDVVRRRYQTPLDPDSDAGRLLGALAFRSPFDPADPAALNGQADPTELTLVPTPGGQVSVRAAAADDALVLGLPAVPVAFVITPPPDPSRSAEVAITLLAPEIPLSPPLTAGELTPAGTLRVSEAATAVVLRLPSLLLVATTGAPAEPAVVRLVPEGAAGGLDVAMVPPFALIGPGTAVGIGFERATLALGDPGGPSIIVPTVELFVAPPGLPALAIRGSGRDLRIALGDGGGLTGEFALALAEEGEAARPAFLDQLAGRLRLHRSAVTLAEVSGEIDLQGEVERRLGGSLGEPEAGPIDFILRLILDAGWRMALTLTSRGGDAFLWRTRRPEGAGAEPLRDTLGAYAAFAPLLVGNLPAAGENGFVDLGLGAGAAAGLAAAGLVRTVAVTLFGGELIVTEAAAGSVEGFLFFDLETEFDVVADPLLKTRRPLKVRHRAIGLRLDFGADGADPQLAPVFDPARGFGFDLSDPGTFEVPGPLGEIVQPQGSRMARQNPLVFEADLALKADLGVVTVDRATVRVPIDPAGPPTITALGARVDIPGALSGGGYLQLKPTGFAGSLDASLTPLGVRVGAGLMIEQVDGVTAVLTTLEVELPIPIPLATSGLGIFGFIGLFGMHVRRDQPAPMTALEWFVGPAHGDATEISAWKAQANQWAFGIGAVLGTLEGGFILHAKGMVVVEAPGPRLLILMNADILGGRPGTKGAEQGTFLALIEIDPEVGLTIGIVLDYRSLKPILEVRVPVEAFFDFNQAANWHIDVGGIPPDKLPVSVTFLSLLRAEGYLLLHGNGIPNFPPLKDRGGLQGLSVAAGVRAALTWGPKEIGLYLELAAEADLGISFKPFLILGRMAISGELHLFIIGIEASAVAEVLITPDTFHILAEVCGKVDFFFFDVEGCVTLELGDKPAPVVTAEPLLRAVSLHSRSPALLPGSGVDRAVDGSLADAAKVSDNGQPIGMPKPVPIDTIPVLQFEMAPFVDPGCRFFETAVPPKLAGTDWVRRGRQAYRYALKSIVLGPAPGEGEKPVVWWDRIPKNGGDRDVQLALLNWIPEPTPAAAERTVSLDERVGRRWGTSCEPVAPGAAVLWSFHGAAVGPSPVGWMRRGLPWPDVPGTWRSSPSPDILRVSEPWRSDNRFVDGLSRVEPAIAFGAPATFDRILLGPRTGLELRPAVDNNETFAELFGGLRPSDPLPAADALRLDADGLTRMRLLLAVDARVWEVGLLRLRALDASASETGLVLTINTASTRQVGGPDDLPSEWTDPVGPWQSPVAALLVWAQSVLSDQHLFLILVEADLPEGTTQVEIGAEGEVGEVVELEPTARYWGVLLAEGTSAAETRRVQHDETIRQAEIDTVNGALGADQGKRALLAPNTTYTVDVAYDVAVADLDGNDNPVERGVLTDQTQRFTFATDAEPPPRLDPWVLMTDPAPAQGFVFWGEPIRVIFATNAARALYKAYGRDLFAVARAASGRQPAPPAEFDPLRVRLDATVAAAEPLAALATTPWERAIGDVVADLPCIEHIGESVRHERVTLAMPLEPVTDYILDLETEPSAGDPLHPLLRRHFTTGRYENAHALAAAVASVSVRHRHLANPATLTALGNGVPAGGVAVVSDRDIEQALRNAAWGDLGRPADARVTVIWHGAAGSTPQPVALLLDGPEPLWRQREVPEEVKDAAGTRRFRLVARPWLDIVADPAAAPLVERLVAATEGSRTLILLRPGARGGILGLSLRRHRHPLFEGGPTEPDVFPLVTADLTNAPWEE